MNPPLRPALPSRELYFAIGEHGGNQRDQAGFQLLKFVTSTVDDGPVNVADAIVGGLSCQVEGAVVLWLNAPPVGTLGAIVAAAAADHGTRTGVSTGR